MKKTCTKILIITFFILMIYASVFSVVAINTWIDGTNFLDAGATNMGNVSISVINEGFEEILNFLYGIGILVVFATTIVLGMRYMMVSPNEKSKIKQATTPWIIGVVIIFGAVTIWRLIISILDGGMGIGG